MERFPQAVLAGAAEARVASAALVAWAELGVHRCSPLGGLCGRVTGDSLSFRVAHRTSVR